MPRIKYRTCGHLCRRLGLCFGVGEIWGGTSAQRNHAPEQVFRERTQTEMADGSTACWLAENCDAVRVTAEKPDVVLDPSEGPHLLVEAVVTLGVTVTWNDRDRIMMAAWWRHDIWNSFRIIGPLWGKSRGERWIPPLRASKTELWYFICY